MKPIVIFKNSTGVKYTQLRNVISTDNLRPVMQGSYIDFKEHKLVCTDSYILAIYPLEITELNSDLEGMIINPKLFNTLSWMDYQKNLFDMVEYYVYEEKTDVVCCGKVICSAENIEGKYPNWKAILPTACNNKESFGYDRKILKRLTTILPNDFNDIWFSFGNGMATKFNSKFDDLEIYGVVMQKTK